MASSKWKSTDEINKIIQNRKYIFWGASNWIGQTLNLLDSEPEFIVDTNPNNNGIQFEGYTVKSPNFKEISESNYFVIISTGNYDTLCQELIKENLEMGNDFCVSPLLEKRAKKDKLLSFEGKVLFASPQHLFKSDSGGGIYELDLKTAAQEKIYTGKCRTVIKYKENFAVVDMLKGIQILNKEYEIIGEIKLPSNTEPHGLYFDEDKNLFFVGCPGNDCIYALNENSKIVNTYRITNKYKNKKADFHHINDVFSTNGSLFASMFSLSGNWTNQSYDGGVVEFDINTGECYGVVWDKLWMPHSITRYKNTLVILDSMTGRLISSDHGLNFKLPGFVRGLDFKGEFSAIAVSGHRYPEKVKNFDFPVMMNSAIFLIDIENSLSKVYSIKGTETIHSIIFK